jgi:signal transduction histidine kinase
MKHAASASSEDVLRSPLGAPREGEQAAAAKAAALARRALQDRPWFSIRMQVYLTFAVLLLIGVFVASSTITTTARVETHVYFFEKTTRLLEEVERARSFERDFFQHGTKLDGAIDAASAAHAVLTEHAADFVASVGRSAHDDAVRRVERYADLLSRQQPSRADPSLRSELELETRQLGAWLVEFANDLQEGERHALNEQLDTTTRLQKLLSLVLGLFLVTAATLLVLRIAMPFRRFDDYTRRIAAGDITPITPARFYRDEFSLLADSLNGMLMELDRSQRALAHSQKLRAVGTLSASVAHEINNPVNNIMLSACSLLEKYERTSDEERKALVSDIVQESRRTREIIRRLLDLARQSDIGGQKIELLELGAKAVRLAEKELDRKGVKVAISGSERLPLVHGDELQLSQVVLNLVMNAADASPAGAQVELSLDSTEDGRFVSLSVRDHGTGIPDDVLPLIFDPFFTTKSRGKGTGLGLAISKEIVQRHDGDLTLETTLGEGTVATMTLPVAEIPADLDKTE